jgi:hypothetical protein
MLDSDFGLTSSSDTSDWDTEDTARDAGDQSAQMVELEESADQNVEDREEVVLNTRPRWIRCRAFLPVAVGCFMIFAGSSSLGITLNVLRFQGEAWGIVGIIILLIPTFVCALPCWIQPWIVTFRNVYDHEPGDYCFVDDQRRPAWAQVAAFVVWVCCFAMFYLYFFLGTYSVTIAGRYAEDVALSELDRCGTPPCLAFKFTEDVRVATNFTVIALEEEECEECKNKLFRIVCVAPLVESGGGEIALQQQARQQLVNVAAITLCYSSIHEETVPTDITGVELGQFCNTQCSPFEMLGTWDTTDTWTAPLRGVRFASLSGSGQKSVPASEEALSMLLARNISSENVIVMGEKMVKGLTVDIPIIMSAAGSVTVLAIAMCCWITTKRAQKSLVSKWVRQDDGDGEQSAVTTAESLSD